MCRVCVCTCVNVCAHVLTPAHVWYSDDGHRFADEHPPTLCHQPETAMSSSLHPPSLCSLVLLSPRSPHLILSHAPPTPPHPTDSCVFFLFVFHLLLPFLLGSCPLPLSACSSACHLLLPLLPDLHPSLSDHTLSAVFLSHGLSLIPSQCLFFSLLMIEYPKLPAVMR